MPREPRKFSNTQVYHIMFKGIDNQDIFYEKKDRKKFLEILSETKKKYKYKIYAYCLMTNHIHLVIEIENKKLSNSMKSLGIRYVFYFNKKYSRSGPLFHDRFNSKCVENRKYFLDVCRYVEQNPEKAGICNTKEYKWSSYHEYIGESKIIDKQILLHYFDNNIENYKYFTTKGKSDNKFDYIDYELKDKFSDDDLAEYLLKELNLNSFKEFSEENKEELKKYRFKIDMSQVN